MLFCLHLSTSSVGQAQAGGAPPTFADVALILQGRCVMCQSGPAAALGLRLDGLALEVSKRTRIDKRPSRGDYVEVRRRLDADGRVVAERIRRR